MKSIVLFILFSIIFTPIFGQQKPVGLDKKKSASKPPKPNSVANISIPETILINGGTFNMGYKDGDEDERPVHEVKLNNFRIGKYEVTYKEFSDFINETGHITDAEKDGYSHIYSYCWEPSKGVNWRHNEQGKLRTERDRYKPVIHVSWQDANNYCIWLSKKTGKTYRLPTEAEWEFAAGNGVKHTKFSWGNSMPTVGKKIAVQGIDPVNKYVNCESNSEKKNDECIFSEDVGSYAPNMLGLYDISGNVWEWCLDRYSKDYYANSSKENPKGPNFGDNRIIRGANWLNDPINCRITYRCSGNPTMVSYNIGFRIVQQ